MNLSKPEDALYLPKGGLVIGCFEASFSPESVLEAAELLIEKSDTNNLLTQAGVIARAGKHGWGAGDAYSTIGRKEKPSTATAQILDLTDPSDAFKLPAGNLVANFGFSVRVSFSPEDVRNAATLLLQKGDAKRLVSQAGIIARAGKHGWGQGNIYTTT